VGAEKHLNSEGYPMTAPPLDHTARHVMADRLRTLAVAIDSGEIPVPALDVWWHDADLDDAHAIAATFPGDWQPVASGYEGISLDLPSTLRTSLHVYLDTSVVSHPVPRPATEALLTELRAVTS
jgi:hypothetical protein